MGQGRRPALPSCHGPRNPVGRRTSDQRHRPPRHFGLKTPVDAVVHRSWSVVLHGRRFKVEVEKGLTRKKRRSASTGFGDVRVMDERTQLLEKMGMSVAARPAVAT